MIDELLYFSVADGYGPVSLTTESDFDLSGCTQTSCSFAPPFSVEGIGATTLPVSASAAGRSVGGTDTIEIALTGQTAGAIFTTFQCPLGSQTMEIEVGDAVGEGDNDETYTFDPEDDCPGLNVEERGPFGFFALGGGCSVDDGGPVDIIFATFNIKFECS